MLIILNLNNTIMKSIGSKLKEMLFFDKELVALAKKKKVTQEQLYNHLINGKITMKEYFSLV